MLILRLYAIHVNESNDLSALSSLKVGMKALKIASCGLIDGVGFLYHEGFLIRLKVSR